MAIPLINTGTTANDGSGDSIRSAFRKANTAITSLESPTSTGSTTARMMVDRLAEVRNIKDFGAAVDGTTDDAAAVAAAIASLGPSGGTVVIPGLTAIGAAGITLSAKTNVTLRGVGIGCGFISLAATTVNVPATVGSGTLLALSGCTGCRIEGLSFDGGGFPNKLIGMSGCTDTVITECDLTNWTSTAVNARGGICSFGGTRNTFSHNRIHDSTGSWAMGMYIGNTNTGEVEQDADISHNIITDVSWDGIVGTLAGGRIQNNTITGAGASGIALGTTAAPNDYKRTLISGNVIRGCTYHGIQADSVNASQYVSYIDVANNIVEENEINGIYCVRARDWTITGNICRNNNIGETGLLVAGIYLDNATDVIISSNNCSEDRSGASRTQDAGIVLSAQDGNISRIQIFGNLCRNNLNYGIYVANVAPKTIDGVSLVGNGVFSNSEWGLIVAHSSDGFITNTVIAATAASGNTTGQVRNDPTDTMMSDAFLGYTSKNLHSVGNLSEHPKGIYVGGDASYHTSTLNQFSGVTAVGNGVTNYSVFETNGNAYFIGGASFSIGTNTAHSSRFEVQSNSNAQIRAAYSDAVATNFQTDSAGKLNITPTGSGTRISGYVEPDSIRLPALTGLPVYANNAAALAGGLVLGMTYRTGGDPDLVAIVH